MNSNIFIEKNIILKINRPEFSSKIFFMLLETHLYTMNDRKGVFDGRMSS